MCSADDLLNKKKLNYKQQAPRSPVILILYRTVLLQVEVVAVRSKQFALFV